MKTVRSIGLCVLTQLPFLGGAFAQGIPVYDNSNLVQQIQQVAHMAEQLRQMERHFDAQLRQLEELEAQLRAVTGARNMGDLANGALDQAARRYLPEDFDDWLTLSEVGATGEMAETGAHADALGELYDFTPGAARYPENPDGRLARAQTRANQVSQSSVAAAAAYDRVQDRVRSLEIMLAELNAAVDLKASQDLHARIAAESALLQAETLRLQAINIAVEGTAFQYEMSGAEERRTMLRYDPATARDIIK